MNPGLQCAQTLIWCQFSAFPPQTKLLVDDFPLNSYVVNTLQHWSCSNVSLPRSPSVAGAPAGSLPTAKAGCERYHVLSRRIGVIRSHQSHFWCVGRLWHALAAAALATGTSVLGERDLFVDEWIPAPTKAGLPQILAQSWSSASRMASRTWVLSPCLSFGATRLPSVGWLIPGILYGCLAVSLRVAAAGIGSEGAGEGLSHSKSGYLFI